MESNWLKKAHAFSYLKDMASQTNLKQYAA
jgi:hypothetical protein